MGMRIAIASNDNRALDGIVSEHFGRCPYYVLADAEGREIKNVQTIDSPFYSSHGQLGEVPGFIRGQGANVMIAGGMGPKAIEFFNQFGIEAVTGASGRVRDAINNYLDGRLSGAQSCQEGERHPETAELGSGELSQLREEVAYLQKQFAEMEKKIANLERGQ
jgi:predicted Fe-Mo cluster-binding NifX family protein